MKKFLKCTLSSVLIISMLLFTASFAFADEPELTDCERGEHVFEKIETEPSCLQGGYVTYTCTVCGYSFEDDFTKAAGHRDTDNDGICNGCGQEIDIKNCKHFCHSNGTDGILWKIVCFVLKIFNINQYCSCGCQHYESSPSIFEQLFPNFEIPSIDELIPDVSLPPLEDIIPDDVIEELIPIG